VMGQIIIGALLAWLSGVLSVIAYANYANWMNDRD
jgi:hypothetical protein